MRCPLPVVVGGAAAVAGLGLCSCDSPSTTPTTTTPPVVTLDHCLVGSWKSVSISGGITIAGTRVTLSGGAGELLSITAAGAIATDDSATAPLSGTGGGNTYTLSQSGTARGTISAAAGRLVVKLDQPTSLTVTLSRNGTVLQTQHPGSATDSYACTAATLVITGGGGTVSTYGRA